jgi:hypothetical protein
MYALDTATPRVVHRVTTKKSPDFGMLLDRSALPPVHCRHELVRAKRERSVSFPIRYRVILNFVQSSGHELRETWTERREIKLIALQRALSCSPALMHIRYRISCERSRNCDLAGLNLFRFRVLTRAGCLPRECLLFKITFHVIKDRISLTEPVYVKAFHRFDILSLSDAISSDQQAPI